MATRAPLVRLLLDADEAFIDGFAGGGGTSTGIEMALGRSPDVAINHDAEALAMHAANHPETRHLQTNIRKVNWRTVCRGKRCGSAWFSPDCTFHSKARGGKPFRDRNRARRIRGLAWEAVRCAIAIKPRVLFMENVEEFKDWGPLDRHGRVIASKKGKSFRGFVARLRNLGYAVEWRELRAHHFGAPTIRKRLFLIARCDGQRIVWPKVTHGPRRAKFRTAAECIDFSLPVPSIFLTPAQAKKWGKAHGIPSPKRPLALATRRRIARGIQRFVLDTADPFIIAVRHQDDCHAHTIHEPLRTIPASDREFALVTPFLAPYYTERSEERHARTRGVNEPLPTITTSGAGKAALIVPTLINTRNGERRGQAPRVMDIQQPFNTITAKGSQGALIAATLVNNSELRGDRVYSVGEPIRTLTAANCRTYQLVAAFLAKHNGGHEATGQRLVKPIDTVTTRDQKALVTSHLMKLRGGLADHVHTSQDVRQPAPTLTAGGTHVAEVRAFLVKFYGTKKDGRPLQAPLDTVTTKERFGLVTVMVGGEEYAIVDIGMRMLTPRELFRCQGFPESYRIDCDVKLPGQPKKRLTKKAQTRLVGNSVPPHLAAALVGANLTAQAKAVA